MTGLLERRQDHEDAWKAAYAVHRAQRINEEAGQRVAINEGLKDTDFRVREIYDDEVRSYRDLGKKTGAFCAILEPKPSASSRPHIVACAGANPRSPQDRGHIARIGLDQLQNTKMDDFRSKVSKIENRIVCTGLSLGGQLAQAICTTLNTVGSRSPRQTFETVTYMSIGDLSATQGLVDRDFKGTKAPNYPPTTHYRVAGDRWADWTGKLTPGAVRTIDVEGYIEGKKPNEPLTEADKFDPFSHSADKLDAAVMAGALGTTSVTDRVEQNLLGAGYIPIDHKVSEQAYFEGLKSGLNDEDALDKATGIAKGVAEANANLDADIRNLIQAASWNSPVGKNREQKANTLPGKFSKDVTKLNTEMQGHLGVPEANPQKGRQLASLGGKKALAGFMSNPTVFDAQMEKQEEDRNRARDIDAATKSRTNKAERQTEMTRDRQELARAAEINERRDVSALADQKKVTVAPTKTDVLGSSDKPVRSNGIGQLKTEMEAVAEETKAKAGLARAARKRENIQNKSHPTESGKPTVTTRSGEVREMAPGLAYQGLGGNVGAFGGGPSDNGPDARVICTELVRQGRLNAELYFLDLRFAEERLSPAHLRGYHLWAVPLVRLMRRSNLVTNIVAPLAGWRAEEVAHVLGKRPRGSRRGKIVRFVGEPLCWLLGRFACETDYSNLYEQETSQ
jgi:hypothetical protein